MDKLKIFKLCYIEILCYIERFLNYVILKLFVYN